MPIELDKDNFREVIENNTIVFVDFWAPWCGPCRSFAPVYEEIAEEHEDVIFAKVNTEQEQELAGAFNIRSIPTLMAFREKVIVFSQAGALPKNAMQQVVDAVKGLDMEDVHRQIAEQQGDEKQA